MIGETELVGGLGLERGIGWVGRSGSVGGSRLFVGSGFSGEAGLVGGLELGGGAVMLVWEFRRSMAVLRA